MLIPYHYTEKDSTKNKPHYTISFTNSKGQHIGGYSLMGYYLYNVYIMKDFQNKGYCKQIVSYAVNKKKHLVLDVDIDNKYAIKCYESCGFKFVRLIKNFHHITWGPNIKPRDVLRFKH